MKHFSKPLSWLLAFMLVFISLISTGTPVYVYGLKDDIITLDEDTNEVIPSGTSVKVEEEWSYLYITYYESADSETVLYEDTYANEIGAEGIAIQPYAWHIQFVEKKEDHSGTTRPPVYYFKAYPDTSLDDIPEDDFMIFPEDTELTLTETTTGSSIQISIYIDDTLLTQYDEPNNTTILPSISELYSKVDSGVSGSVLDSALVAENYNLPDLTKLYYKAEFTDKISYPYKLKLTLVPTIEVTFDENTGSPDLSGTKLYAIRNALINSSNLPQVSKTNADFGGWKKTGINFVFLVQANPALTLDPKISDPIELTAVYKELTPNFKLDLENKKITNLLPSRFYAYSLDTYSHELINSDSNGELSYKGLFNFSSNSKLRLISENEGISLNSDFISLKHDIPNKPVVSFTDTSARVVNTNELEGCEFAITSTDDSSLSWTKSAIFTGLTPKTEYKIYARHSADENGFESDSIESLAFTTLEHPLAKEVSNEAPNGVTIADISNQVYNGSSIQPIPLVRDGSEILSKDVDYSFTYSNNINVGVATITLNFQGNYVGTMTKNFNIVPRSSSSGGGSSSSTNTESSPPTILVEFNTDGGTDILNKNIVKGSKIGELPTPEKDGYVFTGWYSDKELTKPYDSNAIISSTTTLYAGWKKEEIPPTDNKIILTIGKRDAKVFESDITNDVSPIIRNGRTMFPARFISESLGAVVTWDSKKQEVSIKGKDENGQEVIILIYIGSNIAFVNGKEIILETPAFIESGRTFTPLRFIAENLGATVDWIGEEQKVVITKKSNN